MKQRLDVHLGPLREQLEADAAALGKAPGAFLRDLYQDWRLSQSDVAAAVGAAVRAVIAAAAPDERYDPADDPRPAAALAALASALRHASPEAAAQGIADVAADLWSAEHLPGPAGLELSAGALAWLDELIGRASQPHTRETMLERLIGDAWRGGSELARLKEDSRRAFALHGALTELLEDAGVVLYGTATGAYWRTPDGRQGDAPTFDAAFVAALQALLEARDGR